MLKFAQKNLSNIERWKAPSNRSRFLKLDLNENPGIFTDAVLEKLRNFNPNSFSEYPEYEEVLEKLSKYSKINPSKILLTNGADQGIDIVLRCLFGQGDKVVLPSPVFSLYEHSLQLLDCDVNYIPYLKNENTEFVFPFDEVKVSIEKEAKGIILCNPNNPLGTLISRSQIEDLVELTHSHNIPCVIDEAYFEFSGVTCADLIEKYDNLVIIRTFSKVFGLAGLRFGYVLAADYLIEAFLKIRGPWDINTMAVLAAKSVLEEKDFSSTLIKSFRERKLDLESKLKTEGFTILSTSTNFVLVHHPQAREISTLLKEQNILVSDVSEYPHSSELLKNVLRIGVPLKEKIDLIVSKIHGIVKNI